jgi:hypothetical protein
MSKITEESILPTDWISKHSKSYSWVNQYGRFDQDVRDAAAERLYNALNDQQRKELKSRGAVTFKCVNGHSVTARPIYSDTTTVGCYSIENNNVEHGTHAPTTIGDFLLTLKILFSVTCLCRKGHKEVLNRLANLRNE